MTSNGGVACVYVRVANLVRPVVLHRSILSEKSTPKGIQTLHDIAPLFLIEVTFGAPVVGVYAPDIIQLPQGAPTLMSVE